MRFITTLLLILNLNFLFPLDNLYVIPIHGDIEPSTLIFVKKSLEEVSNGDGVILFDINTFGGRVDTALKITTLIGGIKDKTTIAFIPSDPEGLGVSWSAGALISFSCSKIFMAKGTSIGAAAPIYLSPEGAKAAEEKTVSAVRGQMASLAEKNGYPTSVALAMVDEDIELYEVEINGTPYLKIKNELTEGEINSARIMLEKGKLLTLTAKQMEYYGISSGTVDSYKNIAKEMQISENNIVIATKTIPDRIIDFLTSSAVLGILMTLGLVTLYLEITSPGFGVLGAIGLAAFATVFIGGQLLGTLDSIELIIFIIGIILLILEIFVIPGFGLAGILGIVSILLSLLLSRQDFFLPKFTWEWEIFNRNILIIFVGFLSSLGLISLIMVLFPKLSIFRRLILNTPKEVVTQEKPVVTSGLTVTMLRPVGKVLLGDEVVEARSDGGVIEKGVKVIIIEKNGNKIVVSEDDNENYN